MPARKLIHDGVLASVIGANARTIRTTSGRRFSEVATETGISESMLSKLERGKALPGVLVLANLARALGVKPGALFDTPVIGEAA